MVCVICDGICMLNKMAATCYHQNRRAASNHLFPWQSLYLRTLSTLTHDKNLFCDGRGRAPIFSLFCSCCPEFVVRVCAPPMIACLYGEVMSRPADVTLFSPHLISVCRRTEAARLWRRWGRASLLPSATPSARPECLGSPWRRCSTVGSQDMRSPYWSGAS